MSKTAQQVMSPSQDYQVVGSSLLDGSNFISWKIETEAFLQSKGLAKFIRVKLRTLLDDPDLSADKRMELRDGDEMTLGHIILRCNDSFKEMIVKAKTARKAWKILTQYFEGKETFNKIHLMERLMDGKLAAEGDMVMNVQSYLKEKKQIVRRLADCQVTIPEELQVAILLSRLPESMDTMRRILEADPNVDVDKISRELLRESVRISSKRKAEGERTTEQVHAAAMMDQGAYQRIAAAQSGNHFKRNKRDRAAESAHCGFCGTTGHSSNKCWLNPYGSNFRQNFAERVQRTAESMSKRQAGATTTQAGNHLVIPNQ